MKLYYAAHFENACTTFFYLQIKRAVKLGERKQRGYKDQISFLSVKSYISPQMQERQLLVPFAFCLCATETETKTVTRAGEHKAEWLHKPNRNTRACWKLWDFKTSCSVFTGKKTDFPWSHDWVLTQCVSHYHICWSVNPAAAHVQRESCTKAMSTPFVFRLEIPVRFLIVEIVSWRPQKEDTFNLKNVFFTGRYELEIIME